MSGSRTVPLPVATFALRSTREDRIMKRVSRFVFRCLTGSSLVVVACVIGFHSTAIAQSLGPLVQVTGSDPFSDCTADHVNSQEAAYGGTLYLNTSIEPWVAVDPIDPSRLLVGHQEDRW